MEEEKRRVDVDGDRERANKSEKRSKKQKGQETKEKGERGRVVDEMGARAVMIKDRGGRSYEIGSHARVGKKPRGACKMMCVWFHCQSVNMDEMAL